MRRISFFAALAFCVALIVAGLSPRGPQPAFGACGSTIALTGAGCGAPGGGFTPSCTASTNWLARATNVTLTADKTNYDNLICGLVTDGVFAKLDALYIFAAPDAVTARLNLVQNAFNATETGTVTFSAYHGFTGDASTGFESTGYIPLSSGGNFTQNSASVSAYVESSRAASQNWAEIGTEVTNFTFIIPQSGGNNNSGVNSSGPGVVANANAQGYWIDSRTGATVDTLYKNGSSFNVAATASGSVDNNAIRILASGTPAAVRFSGDQLSAAHIGGGLTGTDAGNLATRVNTFMTAYGINVF